MTPWRWLNETEIRSGIGTARSTRITVRSKNRIDALLARYPGPVSIGPSVPKLLLALTIAGVFIAIAVAFIRFPEFFTASAGTSHGAVRGEWLFRLLILLGVARDMREALAEFGWAMLAFFGIIGLAGIVKIVPGVAGLYGLTLDGEGFVVEGLWRSTYHRWSDVGDFESRELPRAGSLGFGRERLVFNDYRAPKTPIEWLRLTGRNRALTERYQFPADDLAVLMSVWCEWAVADSAEPR
jgi:hypothetical protein